jgi:hypothetical protein
VWRAGYIDECRGWREQNPDEVTETQFLREAAWVVLSSGMKETVVRSRFPAVSESFLWWRSAEQIARQRQDCVASALRWFGHPPKIEAIATIAGMIAIDGIDSWRKKMSSDPVAALQALPFIGPATACHLAKNLGCNIAKPDRHLRRIAIVAGYRSPADLCDAIARFTGEAPAVIDSVLWRYGTLVRGYTSTFAL